MTSAKWNLTLNMIQTSSCRLLEKFVLASWSLSCENMIEYHQCKATNPLQVSLSCDLQCECKRINGNACKVLLLLKQYVEFQSVDLTELKIEF